MPFQLVVPCPEAAHSNSGDSRAMGPGLGLPLPPAWLSTHPKSLLRAEAALRNVPLEQRTKQNLTVSTVCHQGHKVMECS